MIDLAQVKLEQSRLRRRLALAILGVTLCFALLGWRFYYLQVERYDDFRAQAEDNRIALVPAPPTRGLILDRNGVRLAENVGFYTLELVPDRYARLEPVLAELGQLIEITPRDLRRFRRLLEDSRNFETVPLKSRLTDAEVARVAAQRYRLPGVEIRARLLRNYPLGDSAAHVVGYIGRISPDDRKKLEQSGELSRYAGSTHTGKTGLEQAYERTLHGEPGAERVEVSAAGKVVRVLSRSPAVSGQNLVLSIDMRLQTLAEQLYADRRGALVAIEPATGDILAFVSRPGYDPNLFVDGIDPQTWQSLNENPDRPLLNRPLRGTYPPGSTYKPFLALAALETGARRPGDITVDPGYFQLGEHRFRDSRPGGHGSVDLHKSIVVSSDTYFYKLAFEMGVDRIHAAMKPWGFGQRTGIDLRHEATGVLPSSEWKMRRFKQKWYPGETPSVGIGQGYNAFTIMQLAHATATLANGGQTMKPRLVQALEDSVTGARTPLPPEAGERVSINPAHWRLVNRALIDVNRQGTSRAVFADAEYVAAGKTGTAQVISIGQNEKYDARRIAERHRDHSLFIAYAPAESPKIAVALIVENGGFGAQAAAPIARALLDLHLTGRVLADRKSRPAPVVVEIDEAELRDVPDERPPVGVAPVLPGPVVEPSEQDLTEAPPP